MPKASAFSPASTVVAGDPAGLDRVLADCEARGVRARRIDVDYASHTPAVEVLRDELIAALADITPRAADIAMISTVTGETIAPLFAASTRFIAAGSLMVLVVLLRRGQLRVSRRALGSCIVIGILLSDHMATTTEPTQAALNTAADNNRAATAVPGERTGGAMVPNNITPRDITPSGPVLTRGEVTQQRVVNDIQVGGGSGISGNNNTSSGNSNIAVGGGSTPRDTGNTQIVCAVEEQLYDLLTGQAREGLGEQRNRAGNRRCGDVRAEPQKVFTGGVRRQDIEPTRGQE